MKTQRPVPASIFRPSQEPDASGCSIILAGILESLFIPFTSIFLLAILTPVNLILFICKNKNLIQSLLDGSNAARILAFDHVDNLIRKFQFFFGNDLLVLDYVYSNVMIDKAENCQDQDSQPGIQP